MTFKKLNNEEVLKLTPQELQLYMDSYRLANKKMNEEEWCKKTLKEKRQSIFNDYDFFIDKRGIEDITLEEQIEFGLNNEPSEKTNYVTLLAKHYHSIKTKSPFSQCHKSKFTASTCLIQGVCMDKIKRDFVLGNKFAYPTQEYSSTEQFMMYHKSIIFLDLDSAQKIMDTNDVRKIKEIGRKVSGFNEKVWSFYRSKIVYEGNKAKFEQNEDLKKLLFETKGTTLVEASPNDKIWGIGLSEGDILSKSRTTWKGKNLLGEILTKVRIYIFGEY